MVSMAKCLATQSLQGNAENFIRRAKISKKKVKIRVLKSMKKVQTLTLESGFSIKRKSNSSLLKPIYTCCGPKQSHRAIASLGETLLR